MNPKTRKKKSQSLPYLLSTKAFLATIIIVAIILIFSILLYSYSFEFYGSDFFYSHIILSVVAIGIPMVMSIIRKKLYALKNTFQKIFSSPEYFEKYEIKLEKLLDHRIGSTLISLLSVLVGMVLVIANSSGWPILPRVVFTCFIGFILYLSSSVGWYYVVFTVIISQLRRLNFHDEPLLSKIIYFREINQSYLQVFFTGFIFYLAAVFSVYIVPLGTRLIFGSSIGYLAVFPLGGLIVLYFITAQYYLHLAMQSLKQSRIEKINNIIQEKYLQWLDSTNEGSEVITNLILWAKEISDEQEWPTNIQTSLTIIGTSLIPIIVSIIEIFTNYLNFARNSDRLPG